MIWKAHKINKKIYIR